MSLGTHFHSVEVFILVNMQSLGSSKSLMCELKGG